MHNQFVGHHTLDVNNVLDGRIIAHDIFIQEAPYELRAGNISARRCLDGPNWTMLSVSC